MQAVLADLGDRAQVLERRSLLAEGQPPVVGWTAGDPERVRERALLEVLRPVGVLDREGGGIADPAGRLAVPVVVDDERRAPPLPFE